MNRESLQKELFKLERSLDNLVEREKYHELKPIITEMKKSYDQNKDLLSEDLKLYFKVDLEYYTGLFNQYAKNKGIGFKYEH